MLKTLITSLPSNILNNINYLKQDYLGLNPDFDFLINFTLGFIISISFLIISLLIGQKIRSLFFRNADLKDINYLIDTALGTIALGTGVALLGFFSFLKTPVLLSYLGLLLIISFYKFNPKYLKNVKKSLLLNLRLLKKNKFVFIWITLFIILALVNLVNPEIREDQYHVDLPKIYLEQQTVMIPPKEGLRVSASPLLSEMTYLVGIFLWSNESARYIHFTFYLLVLLTLFEFSKIKGYKFSIYAPLLFATAPVVIHETSSMYVDFQWIFYFLLSILIILKDKKITYTDVALSGILLGGMVSSKLWTIVFIPVFMFYLIITLNKTSLVKRIKYLSISLFSLLSISFVWFLRAYILTGNPLYPAFVKEVDIDNNFFFTPIWEYLKINNAFINLFNNINVFSPLFFLGCFFFLYKFQENLKIVSKLNLFKFFSFLLLVYIFINYPYGRYLLGIYVLFIFFASIGFEKVISNFKKVKVLLIFLLIIFFLYYFVNSLLIIPYTIGFANKNNYLTRILSKDNSSYYDFNHKFDKYISKNDNVATYRIFGYYYINFHYIDTNYIFSENHKDFDYLKEKGITKLFVKGGDINYFCKKLELKNCNTGSYSYISNYMGSQPYYLYNIK